MIYFIIFSLIATCLSRPLYPMEIKDVYRAHIEPLLDTHEGMLTAHPDLNAHEKEEAQKTIQRLKGTITQPCEFTTFLIKSFATSHFYSLSVKLSLWKELVDLAINYSLEEQGGYHTRFLSLLNNLQPALSKVQGSPPPLALKRDYLNFLQTDIRLIKAYIDNSPSIISFVLPGLLKHFEQLHSNLALSLPTLKLKHSSKSNFNDSEELLTHLEELKALSTEHHSKRKDLYWGMYNRQDVTQFWQQFQKQSNNNY